MQPSFTTTTQIEDKTLSEYLRKQSSASGNPLLTSAAGSGDTPTPRTGLGWARAKSGATVVTLPEVTHGDVSSVRSGTPAAITVDEYPNETFAGKIAREAGAFDPSSRTLLLEIDVPKPGGRLFAGRHAHARFSLPSPTATLLVPNNAILIDAKGARIVVVDSSNKIHIKSVKLGRDFGTKTEILIIRDARDRVVQNPADDLNEGMPVSLQSTTQGAQGTAGSRNGFGVWP